MKQSISQIDRNFLAGSSIDREEIEWYCLPDERFEIRGLAEAKDTLSKTLLWDKRLKC